MVKLLEETTVLQPLQYKQRPQDQLMTNQESSRGVIIISIQVTTTLNLGGSSSLSKAEVICLRWAIIRNNHCPAKALTIGNYDLRLIKVIIIQEVNKLIKVMLKIKTITYT